MYINPQTRPSTLARRITRKEKDVEPIKQIIEGFDKRNPVFVTQEDITEITFGLAIEISDFLDYDAESRKFHQIRRVVREFYINKEKIKKKGD